MSFRVFNQKLLEPGAILFMILGIVFLCQPWIEFLHIWSVLVMLIGIIAFNVAAHIPPPEGAARIDEDDTGPASLSATVKGGDHG